MFFYNVDENIQLKILELKYTDEFFALVDRDRDYLRQWLPWVDQTKSSEDTKKFIQTSLEAFSKNGSFPTAIFYEGEIAGCIGVHDIDWRCKKTSIGYWLSSGLQGKGIMTKSVKAIIDYLFGDLQLNRIEIRAAVDNTRSRSIPERLGFTQEGIIRRDEWLYDRYIDHVVYGILKDEWKS